MHVCNPSTGGGGGSESDEMARSQEPEIDQSSQNGELHSAPVKKSCLKTQGGRAGGMAKRVSVRTPIQITNTHTKSQAWPYAIVTPRTGMGKQTGGSLGLLAARHHLKGIGESKKSD